MQPDAIMSLSLYFGNFILAGGLESQFTDLRTESQIFWDGRDYGQIQIQSTFWRYVDFVFQ